MKNILIFISLLLFSTITLCSCGEKMYYSISLPETPDEIIIDEQSNVINCVETPYWFFTDSSYEDFINSKIESNSFKTDEAGNIYSLYKDGVCLNRCTMSEKSSIFETIVDIPEMINGKKVIKLGIYYDIQSEKAVNPATRFNYLQNVWLKKCQIDKIMIPKYVKEIAYGNFYGKVNSGKLELPIKEIIVDEENKYYSSHNGVLFNKNASILLFYPEAKNENNYTVPNSVKIIEMMNFSNTNLREITIGSNVTKINATFAQSTTIKGYKGTVAESFAKENNLEFVPLD